MSGVIPAEIGRLTDLARLSLWGNQLQGEIPPTIGSLDNVTHLSLWANQFRGSIPAELGDMASLEWVALGINELTGEIPPELGNLSNLPNLNAERPDPRRAGQPHQSGLDWVLVQPAGRRDARAGQSDPAGPSPERRHPAGHLSGAIPPELGNLTDLTVLGLEQNQLTGEIPAELGNLVNLYTLLLAENQLTGCAPAELEAVPDSDLYELGLPICEAEADPPAEA